MCAPTRRWKDLPLPGTEGLCRRYAAQPSAAAVGWVLPAAAPAQLVPEEAAAVRACLSLERAEDESDASRERPWRGLVPLWREWDPGRQAGAVGAGAAVLAPSDVPSEPRGCGCLCARHRTALARWLAAWH